MDHKDVKLGNEIGNDSIVEQIESALSEVLGDAGCALVGGHTGVGLELSLGFSLTGLVAASIQ